MKFLLHSGFNFFQVFISFRNKNTFRLAIKYENEYSHRNTVESNIHLENSRRPCWIVIKSSFDITKPKIETEITGDNWNRISDSVAR